MGLEGGIDRKQAEAFKALYRRWTGDAVQFRFLVTILIMLGVVLLVELPLADRLAKARTRHKDAIGLSALSHDAKGFVEQMELYDPHVGVSSELVDWQGYVMAQLQHTTATLISLEPKGSEAHGIFQVLEMEVVAKGSSYREFVDFIARLEHGERMIRVEKLRLEKHQTTIFLTCQIKGLVKSSAAPAAGKGVPASKAVALIFGPPSPFAVTVLPLPERDPILGTESAADAIVPGAAPATGGDSLDDVPHDAAHDDSLRDDTAHDDAAHDDSARDDTARDDTARDDTMHDADSSDAAAPPEGDEDP
jgi:hypothetical protein